MMSLARILPFFFYILILSIGFIFVVRTIFFQTQNNKSDYQPPSHQIDEHAVLEKIANETQNSKGPNSHNYTRIYYKYFAEIRNKPIKFLEIGLFQGSSVRLWEAYFPNADLHFIDITDKNLQYHSNRSKYHIFDQSNPDLLSKFAQDTGPFDLIIDDGGHLSTQIIASFKVLFPFLKPGGIYVVEDLHTAYWSEFGGRGNVTYVGIAPNGRMELKVDGAGTKPDSSISFFKDLIDDVNFLAVNTGYAAPFFLTPELRKRMTDYALHIDSLHFYGALCFVFKV